MHSKAASFSTWGGSKKLEMALGTLIRDGIFQSLSQALGDLLKDS